MSDRRSSPGVLAVLLAVCGLWSGAVPAGDLPIKNQPLANRPDQPVKEPPISDPTRPPGVQVRQPGKPADHALRLLATRISPSGRSAVINDEVVGIGTRIAGATVTAIEQGRVKLERGAETIVLNLSIPPVKRPARDSS